MRYAYEASFADKAMTVLASVSIACLAFNMFSIAAFADELFVRRSAISGVGTVILAGFVFVLLFNIFCIARAAYQLNATENRSIRNENSLSGERLAPELMAFGVISSILMAGEKAMIDEIGRETLLGWETAGEWFILYSLLSVQFAYTLSTLTRISR